MLIDCNSQSCNIQQDVLKHLPEPEGAIPLHPHLYLANVLKLAKLCWPVVNGHLLQGKLEHVCASEQVPVSGSAVTHVRANGSFIGPLKKWVEE